MTWPEYMAGCCRLDGCLTRLTLQEADYVLALLLSHPDRWTSAADLIDRIWPDANTQPLGASRQIKVTFAALRRRGIVIEGLHGWGYRIPAWARGRPERVQLAA